MSVEEEPTKEQSGKLIERQGVNDSPFTIVTTEEGSCITMGKYRLSKFEKEKQKLIDMILEKPWSMIVSVIMIMMEHEIKDNNFNNQNQQQ